MLTLRMAMVVLGCACAVQGYGTGAPPEACGDMIPQHHTPPQNSQPPYGVRVTRDPKQRGLAHINVSGQGTFKGFFVQCRVGDTPAGKFIDPPKNVKLVDCAGGASNAATHADKLDKREINLTWKAPPNLKEKVTCRATVARDGGHFWVGILSEQVNFA